MPKSMRYVSPAFYIFLKLSAKVCNNERIIKTCRNGCTIVTSKVTRDYQQFKRNDIIFCKLKAIQKYLFNKSLSKALDSLEIKQEKWFCFAWICYLDSYIVLNVFCELRTLNCLSNIDNESLLRHLVITVFKMWF